MIEYNECQPIVIFPLGIACQTTNPTSATTSDGVASLIVTGGTPPYNILWGNGNTTQIITNLSVGSYPVTVTDYYGDFTANTICNLAASAQTTTTTTSTTSQPTYDLCMVINYLNSSSGEYVLESIHFNPNGLFDEYQSWVSDDENYTITWNNLDNVWQLNDYGQTIINSNPNYPPFNNWVILGNSGTITVSEGECQNIENLNLNVSYNPTTCTNCDGVITLVGIGGTPPYEYSINGGLTWSTNGVFQELCPDVTYSIKVKDSTDTIFTPTVNSTILFPSVPITTYSVSLNTSFVYLSSTSYQNNYTINVNPPLPAGVTLNFDVILQNTFQRTPYINSANGTFTSSVIKNGVPITTYVSDVNDTTIPNTSLGCTSYQLYRTTYTDTYESLTYTSTDNYVITTVVETVLTCDNTPPLSELVEGDGSSLGPLSYGSSSTTSTVTNPCCQASFTGESGIITNLSLDGCDCCNVNRGYFSGRS